MAQHRCGRAGRLALPATGDHGGGDRGLDQCPGRKGGAVMTSEHQPTLHHTETAQIIQYSASRPKFGKSISTRSGAPYDAPESRARGAVSNPQCVENVSATCKNQRLRQQRHVNWRKADSIREYWRASMKMGDAISRVQNHSLPEGDLHHNTIRRTIGQDLRNIARQS